MNSTLTKYSFLAGACYFVAMSIAHFFGIKLPILFVYYDTPFYAYQDKIISFAVWAYVALFWAASKHRDVAIVAIGVMAITALGLSVINLSEAFIALLQPAQTTLPYWLQTGAIGSYVLYLAVLYVKDADNQASH